MALGQGGRMLRLKLFGQFSVEIDGQPAGVPTRVAQALLAYLVLNAGILQRRERLAGIFWPDASEANARSNLRHALWRILADRAGHQWLLLEPLHFLRHVYAAAKEISPQIAG